MQKEGYAGAREMMKPFEYLYGWQATAPETVSPTVWKKMYDVYVADEYQLGLKEFLQTANPAGKQVMLARLLEIDRQGVYSFSKVERGRMVGEYVRLVSQTGVACSANTCGNRRLQQHVMAAAREMSGRQLSESDVAKFQRRFQEALRNDRLFSRGAQPRVETSASRPSLASDLKVRWVKIGNFVESARQVVRDNPLPFFGLFGCSIFFGALVAFGKRRPQHWSELRLEGGDPAPEEAG